MLHTEQPPAGEELGGLEGRLPRVLFVNDLWGYGTVTMAMAVADELAGHAVCQFAGVGPGFELARKGSFDKVLRVDTMAEDIAPELERALADSDLVVTVMNDPVAWQATALEKPCVYLDCLTWMWDTPPDVPPGVPYFAERFPGAAAKLEQWRDRLDEAAVVGPLVCQPTRARSASADAILVNFGGLSCPLLDLATAAAYADSMIRCVLTALDGSADRVIVAVGRHVLEAMDSRNVRLLSTNVELADLGHDAYMAELRRSRLLISSAGMHALYEASAVGVAYMCLPAQNQSGSLAMDVLARAGADRSLDWTHLYEATGLDSPDQADACNRIAACIHRFRDDTSAQAVLVQHLRQALDPAYLTERRQQQARFFHEQGNYGAPDIARRVLSLLPVPAAV
jgi:hypothetical protein